MGKNKIFKLSILILGTGLVLISIITANPVNLFTQITYVEQQHYGWPNAEIYIEGTGFGSSQGTRVANLGTYALSIMEWTNTYILGTVPGGVPYGKHYSVYIKEGTSVISNYYDFLLKMWPEEVTPSRGHPGSSIEINGFQFGTTQGSKILKIGSYDITGVTSWSNSTIEAVVPAIPAGDYKVYIKDSGEVISTQVPFSVIWVNDLIGVWNSGIWYRNSLTGYWVGMSTAANPIAAGDLDGDSIDDLIGVWASGLWVKYSATGAWAKLSAPPLPTTIACGDMNGDGRDDIVGSWPSGTFYRDTLGGGWVHVTSAADVVAASDLDGDDKDDLVGVWSDGLWVKFSFPNTWVLLDSHPPDDIACGDVNGDEMDDIVGTWPSGTFYWDNYSWSWVYVSTPADLVAAGYMDGDITSDLIGTWSNPAYQGLWVKYSMTSWKKITKSLPTDIDAGLFRGGAWDADAGHSFGLQEPVGVNRAEGPENQMDYQDFSDEGPGGRNFEYRMDANFESRMNKVETLKRIPGPGEPGFSYVGQPTPIPKEVMKGLEKRK
jgi:hypothetical protein